MNVCKNLSGKNRNFFFLTVFLLFVFVPDVNAGTGVISGFFRGGEPKTSTLGSFCFSDGDPNFIYQVFTGVSASESGSYNFSDTGHHYDLDTQVGIYTSFDPLNPSANRVGYVDTGEPGERSIALQSGTNYTVVIQACDQFSNKRGEWSFVYNGPGTLSGPAIYDAPVWSSGNFDGTEPQLEIYGGQYLYEVKGPIRVPRTGEYRYSDSSVHFAVDVIVNVYDSNFNPSAPFDNLIRGMDDGDYSIVLEEGTDYYLVVTPYNENDTGDYEFVLLGPDPSFQITEGLNGAWANLDTLGQGILMEVYPDIPLLFAAWFTWDTTQPDPGETAVIGDPNHRWLTASGSFSDSTAVLDVGLSTGGIFDDPAPTGLESVGSMTIDFLDCSTAAVEYSVSGLERSFTMKKLADDNKATCEMLANQKKVPFE